MDAMDAVDIQVYASGTHEADRCRQQLRSPRLSNSQVVRMSGRWSCFGAELPLPAPDACDMKRWYRSDTHLGGLHVPPGK